MVGYEQSVGVDLEYECLKGNGWGFILARGNVAPFVIRLLLYAARWEGTCLVESISCISALSKPKLADRDKGQLEKLFVN